MNLLLTGDLHLGRTSTRLPEAWRERGRTLNAWKRLVEAAVRDSVDAVVLSGDLLDESNRLWEAMGPFSEGLETLGAAGIPTLAVSGNHDADVLPELAAGLPPHLFRLLGADGAWERTTLEKDGRPVLHVVGWSFPASRVRRDPTLDFPEPPGDGVPVLGLVHGDPDVPDSRYAPLSTSRLRALPVDGWLLGHIHTPSLREESPWILMPGSPHPLDPGEPGPHHAWKCETGSGPLPLPKPFCPAGLRYRSVELDLAPEDDPGVAFLQRRLTEAVEADPSDALQVLRLVLSGTSPHLRELEEATRSLTDWRHPRACVESVRLDVHPVLDREAAASAGPVPALVAQALSDPPPELRERLEAVCRDLNRQREFAGCGLPDLAPDDLPASLLLERVLRHTLS